MKFKNILFPVDFSDSSRALNREVEHLANRFNSGVTLMHVFEIPCSWYGSGDVSLINTECLQQYMNDVRQHLNEYSIDIPKDRAHRVLAERDAAWQIKTAVAENNFDLVVIGTHGYGSVRRLLLGSVAMKVLHDVRCPVWTHSIGERFDGRVFTGVKTMLCAVELDYEAVPLLRFVSELARELQATVRLIHSVPDDASRPYRYFDTDLHRFLVKLAQDEISKLQAEAGTYFNVDLVEQPIAEATALAAAEQEADLIVIGRGRTQRVLGALRTHAYDIIREANCPVLSFSAPEANSQSTMHESSTREAMTAK